MLVSIAASGSIGSGCSWFLDFLLAFFPATLFDENCADAFLFFGATSSGTLDLEATVSSFPSLLKVAFIQKVLVHSSLPQTDTPYYFPVLEFKNCWILKGSNPVT